MQDRFQYRAKDVKTGEWHYGFYAELPYGPGSSGCNGEYADVDSFILNCKTKQSALYSNAEPHEIVVAEQNRIDIKTLSQCTGLKDKNGKLIYEGDILFEDWKNEAYPKGKYWIVKWDNNNAGFYIEMINPSKFENFKVWRLARHDLDYEVIGNIYENPELLAKDGNNE